MSQYRQVQTTGPNNFLALGTPQMRIRRMINKSVQI